MQPSRWLDALILESRKNMTSTSRREIEAMQLRKLNALLKKEHDRQGFYRDLPASLRSLNDLKALPFTTAEDLRGHGAACCSCRRARWSAS